MDGSIGRARDREKGRGKERGKGGIGCGIEAREAAVYMLASLYSIHARVHTPPRTVAKHSLAAQTNLLLMQYLIYQLQLESEGEKRK